MLLPETGAASRPSLPSACAPPSPRRRSAGRVADQRELRRRQRWRPAAAPTRSWPRPTRRSTRPRRRAATAWYCPENQGIPFLPKGAGVDCRIQQKVSGRYPKETLAADRHQAPRLLPQGRRLPVGLPGPHPGSRIHPADRRRAATPTPTWSTGSRTSSPASSAAPATAPASPPAAAAASRKRSRPKPEPVAICRLKRVAADYKDNDEVRRRSPQQADKAERQAHRLHRRRPGLAHRRARPRAARLRRHRVRPGPARRRHDLVADPALPPADGSDRRGSRLHPRPRRRPSSSARSTRMKAAAGRGLRRDLRRLRRAARPRPRHPRPQGRREEHPHRHRLALVGVLRPHRRRSASASSSSAAATPPWTAAAPRKRLGGDDVKVIVRSGFEEMKASPWEKEDAQHEGIPILNFLVPKAFVIENGKLDRHDLREGQGRLRRQGPPQPRAHRRARPVLRVRRRAGRGRPGERLPLDRARLGHRVRQVGHAGRRQGHVPVDACRTSSSAATAAFGPKNIIWAVAHGHDAAVSIDKLLQRRRPAASARRPASTLMSQKMGIHEWSYDNEIAGDARYKVPWARHQGHAEEREGRGRARLRRRHRVEGGAALPQLRRADGVHRQAVHRVRRLRRHLPDGLHHLHRATATKPTCARSLNAPALNLTQDLYVSGDAEDRRA